MVSDCPAFTRKDRQTMSRAVRILLHLFCCSYRSILTLSDTQQMAQPPQPRHPQRCMDKRGTMNYLPNHYILLQHYPKEIASTNATTHQKRVTADTATVGYFCHITYRAAHVSSFPDHQLLRLISQCTFLTRHAGG